MTITIPPEAEEAAAEALCDYQYGEAHGPWKDAPEWLRVTVRGEARAALQAGLAAWPGMHPNLKLEQWPKRNIALILPLSQEKPNDKA
jgi:hypothetical protein